MEAIGCWGLRLGLVATGKGRSCTTAGFGGSGALGMACLTADRG